MKKQVRSFAQFLIPALSQPLAIPTVHVGEKLSGAFKSPTGIPYALINLRTGVSTSISKLILSLIRLEQVESSRDEDDKGNECVQVCPP